MQINTKASTATFKHFFKTINKFKPIKNFYSTSYPQARTQSIHLPQDHTHQHQKWEPKNIHIRECTHPFHTSLGHLQIPDLINFP